jgi:serine/threonine protein kinase/sugar lactone lactonase YvrE
VTETQESTDGGQQLLLGKKLLERGLITPEQLREALLERARGLSGGAAKPLGTILVDKGFLTDTQLVNLLEEPAGRTHGSSSGHLARPGAALPDPASANRLGKYQLLRELGRGGMGVVYEAVDPQLNRKVALKLMLSAAGTDPKEVTRDEERFVQEAQLSAKLKHPNIVTVYEAGVVEGRRFLAMELVEGQPFSDWRKEAGAPVKQQVQVLRDVAFAVHHAHEQGILHRDLKPRNILVGGGPHPYVTDFGLAKSLGAKHHHSLTGSGAVVGTPAYMSPEQAQGGDQVDWRTDIWSLGIILYEILTGRTPFVGESPIEILMKVVKDPVLPPLQVVQGGAALGLDKSIENICMKALAKRDRDRYVTARAFAEDLTRWLNGEQVKTTAPKVQKKPSYVRALALGVGIGVLLVVGAAFLVLQANRPSVEAELQQARQFMEQGNFTEALISYSQALAKDRTNAEAVEGERKARAAVEAKAKEKEERLKAALEAAHREYERAIKEAEQKAQAEEQVASEAERERLAFERRAAEDRARKAEEEARKTEEQLRLALGTAGQPAPPPAADAWTHAVDLLSLVELPRNVVWGSWSWKDKALASDRERFARLEIPFIPPDEYDLRVTFMRQSGNDAVCLILATRSGKSFSWELGSLGNTVLSLEVVGGAPRGQNPTTVAPRGLDNDRPYVALVQVRRDGVKAFLDGQRVHDWKTAYADLALDPAWKLRGAAALGLGTVGSPAIFQKIELLEVVGKGRRALPAPAAALKARPVTPGALRTGLVAEYFYGANFEVPALRRLDTAVGFDWGENAAWQGGPADGFSVRWTGYLHVPRAGRYSFSAAGDDGVRLFLDGTQMISTWAPQTDAPRPVICLLEEGFHRLQVEYFDRAYLASISISWAEGVGTPLVPIPAKFLYHDPAEFRPLTAARAPELLAVLQGHSNSVTSAAFSADGQVLATASEDRKVKFWSVATRKETGFLSGAPTGLLAVAFHPDGTFVATGGWDGRVRLWDPASGQEVRQFIGHGHFVESIAFSPDGRRLASASFDKTVRVWDVATSQEVRTLAGHRGGVQSVVYSHDGRTIASSGIDRTIRLWDAETGAEGKVLSGHADYVQGLAYSPDGMLLASAGWDGTIKLWDPGSGKELRTFTGHTSEVFSVSFSADGKLLASGGNDGAVRVWDVTSGREVRALAGHGDRVMAVTFARHGRVLASASFDQSVRLWDLKDVR